MLAAVWKFVLASAVAGGATAFIILKIPSVFSGPSRIEAVVRIGMSSIIFVTLYVGAVVVLYGGFTPLNQLARLLREMSPLGRLSKPSSVSEMACATASGEAFPTSTGREPH
jgi:hypothetical protein